MPTYNFQSAARGSEPTDTLGRIDLPNDYWQIMSHGCCRSENILRALGFKVIGDPFSQDVGGGVQGGFGLNLDHGFSVGCDYLGYHAPLVWPDLAGGNAMGSDGKLAAAAEGIEGGALGFDAIAGVGVIEEGDGLADDRCLVRNRWSVRGGGSRERVLPGRVRDTSLRERTADGPTRRA